MRLENLFEMYTAYVLDNKSRRELSKHFPPKYPETVGHHVTVKFGVSKDAPIPRPAQLKVVGYADDGEGLEALVVSVDGKVNRPWIIVSRYVVVGSFKGKKACSF